VACGTNEVKTSVHAKVSLFASLRLLLLNHVRLMLVINKVDNGSPGITVVDIVAETWRVDNSKFHLELFLLQLGFNDLDLGQVIKLFVVSARVVLGGRQFSRKERVNECCLAQTRLAYRNRMKTILKL
jgi:hypothetical protein